MKHLIFLFWLSVLSIALNGCKKEGCTDSKSENYDPKADEDDGSCTYARDKFIGSYSVNENCASGNFSYNLTITPSANGVELVIINNLATFDESIKATISGSNINISDSVNGVNYSGSGTINGSAITLIYSTSGAFDDNCTATLIKQ